MPGRPPRVGLLLCFVICKDFVSSQRRYAGRCGRWGRLRHCCGLYRRAAGGEWTYPPKCACGGFFRRLSERRRTPIRTRAFLTLYEVRRPAATAFFAAFRLRNALQSGSARAAALSRTNKTDSRSTCSPSAFSAYCAVSAASSQACRYRPYSTSSAIAPNSRLTVTVRRRLGCGSTK